MKDCAIDGKHYQPEQNAFQHNLPAIPEVLKFVRLHPSISYGHLAEALEQGYENAHEEAEDDEKDRAGEEDVGLLNARPETNTVNASNHNELRVFGHTRITVCPLVQDLITGSRIDVTEHI